MFPVDSGNIGHMTEPHRDAARRLVADEMARRKMNRAQLAAKAEIDPKTLRAFLDGERWPQFDKRASISMALGWVPGEIDQISMSGTRRIDGLSLMSNPDSVDIGQVVREWSPWDKASLNEAFADAMRFAEVIRLSPTLGEPTQTFVSATTDLYQAASKALDEELSEASFNLRSVAKPGGLEPEEGDLTDT